MLLVLQRGHRGFLVRNASAGALAPAVMRRRFGVQIDQRMMRRLAQMIGQEHVVDTLGPGDRCAGRLIGSGGQTVVAAFQKADDFLHDGVVHGATGLDLYIYGRRMITHYFIYHIIYIYLLQLPLQCVDLRLQEDRLDVLSVLAAAARRLVAGGVAATQCLRVGHHLPVESLADSTRRGALVTRCRCCDQPTVLLDQCLTFLREMDTNKFAFVSNYIIRYTIIDHICFRNKKQTTMV